MGTALVICLPKAVELLAAGIPQLPDDDGLIYDDGLEELLEEDYENMHPELKGIYVAYDDMEQEYGNHRRSGVVDTILDF